MIKSKERVVRESSENPLMLLKKSRKKKVVFLPF